MTEHFLDRSEVSATTKEMRSEGMPKHMGFNGLGNARPFGVLFYNQPYRFSRNSLPSFGQKKCRAGLRFHEKRPPGIKVTPDRGPRTFANGHQPLLGSLAKNADESLVEIDLLDPK